MPAWLVLLLLCIMSTDKVPRVFFVKMRLSHLTRVSVKEKREKTYLNLCSCLHLRTEMFIVVSCHFCGITACSLWCYQRYMCTTVHVATLAFTDITVLYFCMCLELATQLFEDRFRTRLWIYSELWLLRARLLIVDVGCQRGVVVTPGWVLSADCSISWGRQGQVLTTMFVLVWRVGNVRSYYVDLISQCCAILWWSDSWPQGYVQSCRQVYDGYLCYSLQVHRLICW